MATNNKCSNCGGTLNFDPVSGELKCTHCESITDIEDTQAINDKKDYNENSTIKQSKTKYTQFTCKSCNRTHISSTETDLQRCPCCGDALLEKTLNVEYTPDGVIPFKIDYEKAMQSYKSWLKTKKFAPNNLKSLASAQSLVARYIPVYNYAFKCTSNYHGTGFVTRGMGDNKRTERIHFKDTRIDVYDDYLECASDDISSADLRKLGNYNFGNIMVYKTEYLYGFIASQIKTDLHQNCANMRSVAVNDIQNKIKRSLNCRIESFHCNTNFNYIKYNHLYLPMWTNVYKYKDKTYTCYINGQTGKATGTAPKSFWKIFGVVLLGIAIACGIGYLICKSEGIL